MEAVILSPVTEHFPLQLCLCPPSTLPGARGQMIPPLWSGVQQEGREEAASTSQEQKMGFIPAIPPPALPLVLREQLLGTWGRREFAMEILAGLKHVVP